MTDLHDGLGIRTWHARTCSRTGHDQFRAPPRMMVSAASAGVAAYRHDHARRRPLFCKRWRPRRNSSPSISVSIRFILMTGTSIRRAAPLRKASEWRLRQAGWGADWPIGRRNPSFRTARPASRFIREGLRSSPAARRASRAIEILDA